MAARSSSSSTSSSSSRSFRAASRFSCASLLRSSAGSGTPFWPPALPTTSSLKKNLTASSSSSALHPMPLFLPAASLDDFFLANVLFWKNSLGGFEEAGPIPEADPTDDDPALPLDAKPVTVGSFRYAATPLTLTPPKDDIVDVVGREIVVTVLAIVVVEPATALDAPGGLGTPTRVAAGTGAGAGAGDGWRAAGRTARCSCGTASMIRACPPRTSGSSSRGARTARP
mmetsp:Transcript_3119/g.12375  ORF Transcript_3119/g.12375 Transcript_3119/m.12375 type:complete len:228 (-) Transcript_3119:663-1346(-)